MSDDIKIEFYLSDLDIADINYVEGYINAKITDDRVLNTIHNLVSKIMIDYKRHLEEKRKKEKIMLENQ